MKQSITLFFTLISVLLINAQITDTGTNVGIGTENPETMLHIQDGDYGLKSQYGLTILEGLDAQLDIISDGAGFWGSTINFIEGNGATSNTDVWSISRQTTSGNGDSSLRFNFGTNNNHTNSNKVVFDKDGNVGIGTENPEAILHIQDGDYGLKSEYGSTILEDLDAQLDIISDGAGSWGSTINFIEGNGATSNTDVWSISRQTTSGNGDSSLRFNFGTNNNHTNSNKVVFNKDGNVGIGTENPETMLHIQDGDYGLKSQYGLTILEGLDAQLDLISDGAGSWGSTINFIEGNGATSNTDVWSISRQTTSGNGDSSLRFNFGTNNNHINSNKVVFDKDGNVGIGTTDTQGFKLGVNGNIAATEVKVALYNNWADFVFYDEYELPTLNEVENHIQEKGHLKDIPSAAEVAKNGIMLGDMNAKLLQKIEELTLYTIAQEKKIESFETYKSTQDKKMKLLLSRLDNLEGK